MNVLDRVIAYATLRGLKAIWIDQECIEQDDPKDKGFHIQGTDAIYSGARHVVAVLNSLVVEQPHLALFDVANTARLEYSALKKRDSRWCHDFDRVSRPEFEDYKVYAQDIVRAMESDSWFSRVWPFQESMVAVSTLHYLLPCKLHVARPSWIGSMPGQIIVDQWEMHQHLGCYLQGDKKNPWIEPWFDRYLRTMAVANYKNPAIPLSESDVSTHHLGSFNASRLLHGRGLTEKMDRMAIVANVCRYKVRLEIRSVCLHDFDFDLLVFMQAILKGDISLLAAMNNIHASPALVRGPILAVNSWCKVSTSSLNVLRRDSENPS